MKKILLGLSFFAGLTLSASAQTDKKPSQNKRVPKASQESNDAKIVALKKANAKNSTSESVTFTKNKPEEKKVN